MDHARDTTGPDADPGVDGQAGEGSGEDAARGHPDRQRGAGLGQPITGAPDLADEPARPPSETD